MFAACSTAAYNVGPRSRPHRVVLAENMPPAPGTAIPRLYHTTHVLSLLCLFIIIFRRPSPFAVLCASRPCTVLHVAPRLSLRASVSSPNLRVCACMRRARTGAGMRRAGCGVSAVGGPSRSCARSCPRLGVDIHILQSPLFVYPSQSSLSQLICVFLASSSSSSPSGPHLPGPRLRSRHHPARYQHQARPPPSLYMLFRYGHSPFVFVAPSSVSPSVSCCIFVVRRPRFVVCSSSFAFAFRLLLVASGLRPLVYTSAARHAPPRLRCTPHVCVQSRVYTRRCSGYQLLALRCSRCASGRSGDSMHGALNTPHTRFILSYHSRCTHVPPSLLSRAARVYRHN